jgi:hypothetical protein
VGWVGAGVTPTRKPLPAFDDPAQDHTLAYEDEL